MGINLWREKTHCIRRWKSGLGLRQVTGQVQKCGGVKAVIGTLLWKTLVTKCLQLVFDIFVTFIIVFCSVHLRQVNMIGFG
jgi:hypothetical protein